MDEAASIQVAAPLAPALTAAPAAPTTGISLMAARSAAPGATLTVEGVVTVPPGLVNGSFYLADAQGEGLRVYLPLEEFPPLALGDQVRVTGRRATFRGEAELQPLAATSVERLAAGAAPQPAAVSPAAVGEALEGRLVTLTGAVVRVDDDSLYLADLHAPTASPLRVTVLRSLGWPLPAAAPGQVWQVTGVVAQLEGRTPGGGHRLLVRFPSDLTRILVE